MWENQFYYIHDADLVPQLFPTWIGYHMPGTEVFEDVWGEEAEMCLWQSENDKSCSRQWKWKPYRWNWVDHLLYFDE